MRYLLPFLALAACTTATPAEPPSSPLLLVGNKGEDTVSFIDLASGEELARVPTSHTAPHEIAIDPTGTRAAVVNYGDNDIDIFDIASRRIEETVDLGENTRPHGIVWLPDSRILATTEGGRGMVELQPDGIIGSGGYAEEFWIVRAIPTDADGTHMLATDNAGTVAYTANLGDRTVSRIDLDKGIVTHTATAGLQPEGIALTPNGTELWVSARGSNEVYVLDARDLSELAVIPVGRFPLRLLISPDGRHAVTSNLLDGSVTVIDTSTREVTRTIEVAGDAASQQVTLLFSEDGSRLYVAETGTDTVAEIDFASGELLRRLNAGDQGDGLAIVE